jgi:multidrug resistance efflux pump
MSVAGAQSGDTSLEYAKRMNARLEDSYTFRLSDLDKGIDIIFDTPWGSWQPYIPEFLKFDVRVNIQTPEGLKKALDTQARLADFGRWIAWEQLAVAQVELEGKEANLAILKDMKANPLQANLQVDGAKAQYDLAEAEVLQAKAKLDAVQAGTSKEDLAAAQAQLQQAEAANKGLQVRIEKMTLRSPRNGVVLSRDIRLGEMALPGRTLMTIGDLDQATLTVYVSEQQIGRVRVGQRAVVKVDSFPGREFAGQVATIASQAEFTPRSVQTEKSRTSLVFAVRISLDNADHALKPGMPADAQLQ